MTQIYNMADGRFLTIADPPFGGDGLYMVVTDANGVETVSYASVSASGLHEEFGGVVTHPGGGFDLHYSRGGINYVRSFDASGTASGPEAAINFGFAISYDAARGHLDMGDGRFAHMQGDFLIIFDPSVPDLTFGQTTVSFPQEAALVQVGSKFMAILTTKPNADEGETYIQIFNANATPDGPPILLSEGDHRLQELFGYGIDGVQAIELDNGNYAIAYSDFMLDPLGNVTADRQSVWVKIVSPTGGTVTAEFLASPNNGDGDTFKPKLYDLDDGSFALVYRTYLPIAGVDRVELRVFDENGIELESHVLNAAIRSEYLIVTGDGQVLDMASLSPVLLLDLEIGGGPVNETGDSGANDMSGSEFDDVLNGKGGADTLDGLDGDDLLKGGSGADRILGGAGRDTLEGGNGDDLLKGGKGHDTLQGGAGRDTLEGGKGHDVLKGEKGYDLLKGGAGDDTLRGQKGEDTLNGGQGDDLLEGGIGADRFVFADGHGSNVISDFEDGIDEIRITSGANAYADLTLTSVGADVRISWGTTEVLVQNIDKSDLTDTDFSF